MLPKDGQDELLEFARRLALQAGSLIRPAFDRPDKLVRLKSNGTAVTDTDEAVNQLVISQVQQYYPSHGVLGEEESDHAHRKHLWVCDPIDGTNSFIVGQPCAMFSLAYVVDGQPQVAVAYDPFLDRQLHAVKGKGAFVNGQPIHVSQRPLAGSVLLASNSYGEVVRMQSFLQAMADQQVSVRLMGGGVFKMSLIAMGFVESYVFPGRSAHDVAAMQLIVEEAGGKVTDLNGQQQRYDGKIRGAIVTNGQTHEAVLAAVQQFGSEKFLGY